MKIPACVRKVRDGERVAQATMRETRYRGGGGGGGGGEV